MTRDGYVAQARSTGDPPPAGLADAATAEALVDEGMAVIRRDLPSARRLATAARRLARKLRDDRLIGLAERLTGHTELLAGHARRAIPRYERARAAFDGWPDERAATAVAMLQALAYVGDYVRAFEVADEALAWFEGSGDEVRAARVRANLANALHRLDRLEEARGHYERAMPVLAAAGLLGDLAIVARNFGVCLMGLLELDRADAMYAEARTVFEAAGERSLLYEIDLNRAYLDGRRGRLRDALAAYRRLRENLPPELGFEAGHCLLDQADFLLEAGLWADAEVAAGQAAAVFARLGARFELGKTRLIQGAALVRRGHLDDARQALAEARRRLRREPNRNWQALLHQASADLETALGRPRAAYRELSAAAAAGPTGERWPALVDRLADAAIRLGDTAGVDAWLPQAGPARKAQHARRAGSFGEAERWAREAVDAYDAARRRLGPAGLRQAAAAAAESTLRECFRALRDPAERWAVVARLKHAALAEIAATPEALPAMAELRADGGGDEAALEARWREARRLAEPARWESVGAAPAVPTPPPGVRFAELFVDDGRLLAFLIDAAGVREVELGPAADFVREARYFRFHLGRARASDPTGEAVRTSLWTFGQRLAPLAAGDLQALAVGRDAPLGTLPFHALESDAGRWQDRFAVTCAPNAATWAAVRARGVPAADGEPLVIGAPDGLAPAIAAEVSSVAAMLGTRVRPAAELELRAATAPVIHLAAHGFLREDRPLFSGLRLGDREWSVLDAAALRLRADLTTLSGCATGVSIPGESMDADGFVEALLAAGSRAVVASLWPVADEPARRWMEAFYAAWRAGFGIGALRTAADSVRAEFPHPADWAAFAGFGDWDAPGAGGSEKTCIDPADDGPRKDGAA